MSQMGLYTVHLYMTYIQNTKKLSIKKSCQLDASTYLDGSFVLELELVNIVLARMSKVTMIMLFILYIL